MANCVSKADAYCHLKVFRRWDPDYQMGGTLTANGWDKFSHVFVSETPLPTCFDLYTPFPYSLQEEGEGRHEVRLPLGRSHSLTIYFHWYNPPTPLRLPGRRQHQCHSIHCYVRFFKPSCL